MSFIVFSLLVCVAAIALANLVAAMIHIIYSGIRFLAGVLLNYRMPEEQYFLI